MRLNSSTCRFSTYINIPHSSVLAPSPMFQADAWVEKKSQLYYIVHLECVKTARFSCLQSIAHGK